MVDMFEDKEIHLRDYLAVIRKRRWMVFATMVAVVSAVVVVSFKQIPIYRATARILIEKEAPNIVSFKEVLELDTDDQEYYTTQSNILKSRPLAEQVIEKLQSAGWIKQTQQLPTSTNSLSIRQILSTISKEIQKWLGVPETPKTETIKAAEKEERMINRFLSMITITPVRGSRLLDINVTTTDQELAAHIANTLVDVYIQQHLETKLAASKDAFHWLSKELEDVKKKVTDSEAALQKYKEDHAILSLKERQDIVTQKLLELNTAVNQAKIRRMALANQYEQIQSFRKGELETVPQVLNNTVIQQLKLRLLQLESEYLELLKKFREKHPTLTALDSQITGIRNQLAMEIRQIITGIENEYKLAQIQEKDLLKALEAQKAEAQEISRKSIQYRVLEREVESNQHIYETLLQRAKETGLTERLETSNIRIVEQAIIPLAPIAPQKKRNMLLAVIVGLVMGVTLAFFFEYLDPSIRTPEELKQYLEIPFLAAIPKVSEKYMKQIVPHDEKPVLDTIIATITVVEAKSDISEAYRSLRTNVMLSALEQGPTLLITSAVPGEGKSCITANLGITFAQSGKKTLIIDCDFRKPVMDQIFCLNDGKYYGFTDILMSFEPDGIGHVIRKTDIQNLDVIPCGTIPPNPSELLGLEKTERLIKKLGEQYEKILIDSSPVNVVTDPVVLSQIAEGIIFVILTGKTPYNVARYARDQLHEANAKILGGVLNNVDLRKNGHYQYYQYYAYNNTKYYRKEK